MLFTVFFIITVYGFFFFPDIKDFCYCFSDSSFIFLTYQGL